MASHTSTINSHTSTINLLNAESSTKSGAITYWKKGRLGFSSGNYTWQGSETNSSGGKLLKTTVPSGYRALYGAMEATNLAGIILNMSGANIILYGINDSNMWNGRIIYWAFSYVI